MSKRTISRRDVSLGLLAGSLACWLPNQIIAEAKAADARPSLKLGIDNFAVRAMGWKDKQLIDYARSLKVDALFITDFYAFSSLEERHLHDVRQYAADSGIEIYVGNWSICPTSTRFKKDWGTAEEHLRLGIRVAKALGTPYFRVVLGGNADRLTEGGIEARIDDTLKVLKACRREAMDSGIKIAMENHAGDMHSLELVRLIEEAGRDWVGANMDSGNAVFAMEDPLVALENLGPYTLTTSLRDVAVWEDENGYAFQWTAIGQGMIDWQTYFKRFAELCQQAPVIIETISGSNRELPVNSEAFWKAWPKGKPQGYEQFVALAKNGKPSVSRIEPKGTGSLEAEQNYQRQQLEQSIEFCRSLGLGNHSADLSR